MFCDQSAQSDSDDLKEFVNCSRARDVVSVSKKSGSKSAGEHLIRSSFSDLRYFTRSRLTSQLSSVYPSFYVVV